MKKLLVIALFAGVLASCGGENKTETPAPETNTPTPEATTPTPDSSTTTAPTTGDSAKVDTTKKPA